MKRRLSPNKNYKPLDFGNGLLAGCVAPTGGVLNLGTYHPEQGYVTLSALPTLADDERYNQLAVRAYRSSLASADAPVFGLSWPLLAAVEPEVYMLADAIPHCEWEVEGVRVQVTTWTPHVEGEPAAGMLQQWQVHNNTGQEVILPYTWGGPIGLRRASYTQLTEGGVVPAPKPTQRVTFDGQQLSIQALEIEMAAIISGLPTSDAWQEESEGPLAVQMGGEVKLAANETKTLTFAFALAQTEAKTRDITAKLANLNAQESLSQTISSRQARWDVLDAHLKEPIRATNLVHRTQTFILDCCALPIGDTICLLTDHQILPLSWTRDSYFLLQSFSPTFNQNLPDLMRGHLLWLFETAERPEGHWGRAFMANGQTKDPVFQLDQQCYPLLELCEYFAMTQDETTVRRLLPHIDAVLETIMIRQAPNVALFATDETPADDPSPQPYNLSCQILLWHTLRQLDPLNRRWPFTSLDLGALSQDIHDAVYQHMIADHHGTRLFTYATDLEGNHHFYQDANDFPTALAPLWGFCTLDDPVWLATMDFAFSPQNTEGYYPGTVGGLGSVHTRAAWPLGDTQELLYARLMDDSTRANTVLQRLIRTACWDGGFPEARHPDTGAVHSRHWFGWPSSTLAATLLHPGWQG